METLTKSQIYANLKLLAMGNGFYGRVLSIMHEGGKKDLDTSLEYLESLGFRDVVDMCLWFEC